jgi:hypothetical protein
LLWLKKNELGLTGIYELKVNFSEMILSDWKNKKISKVLSFDGRCYIGNAIVINGDEVSNPISIDLCRISLKKMQIFFDNYFLSDSTKTRQRGRTFS